MSRFKLLKKTVAISLAAISISFLGLSAVYSEIPTGGGGDSLLLAEIAANTAGILQKVNNLPALIDALGIYVSSWMETEDKSPFSASFQSNFSGLGTNFINRASTVTNPNDPTSGNALLDTLIQGYFRDATPATINYANDLDFKTLWDQPLWPNDPRKTAEPSINPKLNYLQNISGLNVIHTVPGKWQGSYADQMNYIAYYKTMSAAQTFNGYLFTQVYNDITTGFSAAQLALLQTATGNDTGGGGSNWFVTVASEPLGLVFRHLLLFVSQSYVVQLELLRTQRQLVAAQAVGNSIAIAGNIGSESLLISKATHPTPVGM